MATVPTPRGYTQILGDMIDTFLSRTGLKSLKVGSPIPNILEAAAQSDLRATQAVFETLNASSLETATGRGLVEIAASEGTSPLAATVASGKVTVTDSRYTKVASTIYQGKGAPIVGTTTLYIVDGSSFGSSGNLYIGRGTANYEGPIAYNAVVDSGGYYTITLSTATSKFHNLGESIVKAQGGERTVTAGSVVQTPAGGSSSVSSFSVLYSAVIPDGEVEVTGVQVVAQKPGTSGNVSAFSIKEFSSAPFTGAVATNPLPFTNATDIETEEELRDRIRALRASRSRGTKQAIKNAAVGVKSIEESKRVVSAELVDHTTQTASLVIDDGTGYEEVDAPIAYEVLVSDAVGGEQYLQLQGGRPVAKAFAKTVVSAPFQLEDGMTLAFTVGGVTTEHTFLAADFAAIGNASSYEVAASINADPDIGWHARTSDSGQKVVVTAKANTLEDLQYTLSSGTDANTVLGFDTGAVESVKLYKNDRLLSKDGRTASVSSLDPSVWSSSIASGDTLIVAVDGTPEVTYTVTDALFAANTSYTTVSRLNSAESWATVLEALIPGIQAVGSASGITISSNAGRSSRARIEVTGGTLVTNGLFAESDESGAANDYELNRNTGAIKLTTPLSAGDRLTAGSYWTRSFVESADIDTVTLSGVGSLWLVLDSTAQIVNTSYPTSTTLTYSYDSSAGTMDITAGSAVFANVRRGDWMIAWDTSINAANRGTWRVANVNEAGTVVSVEYKNARLAASGTRSGTVATVNIGSGHNLIAGHTVTVRSNDANYNGSGGGTFTLASVTSDTIAYDDGGSGSAALAGRVTIEKAVVAGAITLSTVAGLRFVRTDGVVQKVDVPAATNYTASTIVDALSIEGATAEVWRTNRVRIYTNTYGSTGSIALVAANTQGQLLAIETLDSVANLDSQLASVETPYSEAGTPVPVQSTAQTGFTDVDFDVDSSSRSWLNESYVVRNITNAWYSGLKARENNKRGASEKIKKIDYTYVAAPTTSARVTNVTTLVIGAHTFLSGDSVVVASSDAGFSSGTKTITAVTSSSISYAEVAANDTLGDYLTATKTFANVLVQSPFLNAVATNDRLHLAAPFAIGPEDTIVTVVDGDEDTKRFITNMYRNAAPIETTYSSVNRFYDLDNGASPTSLGNAFGTSFDWSDFAVHMHARAVAKNGSGKEVLWRAKRWGAEGEYLRVGYAYPDAASQPVTVSADTSLTQWTNVDVKLASGAARTGPSLRNTTRFGLIQAGVTNGVADLVYVLGLEVTNAHKDGGAGPIWTAVVTLNGPAGITDCGLVVGDKVYFESTVDPANFPSGIKTLTAVSGMTIEWEDSLGPVGATPADDVDVANAGSVHFDTGLVTLGATDVVNDDICHIGNATGFTQSTDPVSDGGTGDFYGSSFEDLTLRVDAIDGGGLWFAARAYTGSRPFTTGTPDTIIWRKILSSDQVSFYPLDSAANTIETASTGLVAVVNAAAAVADSDVPVTAQAVGTGAITLATWDEYDGLSVAATGFVYSSNAYRYPLRDGVNWVRSSSWTGSHYQITLKKGVSVDLTYLSNSQWADEEVRFVPITAQGIADYLSNAATGGLQSVAAINVSSGGEKVQIASTTIGSTGSVEVQGGTANSTSATVVGSMALTADNTYGYVKVLTAQTLGIRGGDWVEIVNSEKARKNLFTTAHKITSIATDGTFSFAGGDPTSVFNTYTNATLHFDRQHKYMRVSGDANWQTIDPTTATLTTLGWARITTKRWAGIPATRAGNTVTATLGASHGYVAGDRIVTTSTNPDYASGTFTITSVGASTIVYDDTVSSASPGTIALIVSNDEVSSANTGWFRVLRESTTGAGAFWIENDAGIEEVSKCDISFVSYDSIIPGDVVNIGFSDWGTGNQSAWTVASIAGATSFVVEGTPSAYSSGTFLTATQAASIQLSEVSAQKMVRKVVSITPVPDDGAYSYLKLDLATNPTQIAETYGSTVLSNDKLGFSTDVAYGRDGYKYAVGLIGEVNRVLYGDETDTATYPGQVAVGANVNVVPPRIKSIKVSLFIRLKKGYSARSVRVAVQSAVSSLVSETKVGQSIALGQIVSAAQSVSGVDAASVVSPTYSSSSDRISLQPDEKALVLAPEDVSVSFSGE